MKVPNKAEKRFTWDIHNASHHQTESVEIPKTMIKF